MNRFAKWFHFLRPSVQRDLVLLVHGCRQHPANRAIHRPPIRHYEEAEVVVEGIGEFVSKAAPPCPTCGELYAAKKRVKKLLG